MPPSTAPASSAPAFDHEPSSEGLRLVRHVDQGASHPGIAKRSLSTLTAAQMMRMFRIECGITIGRAATDYGVTAATWSGWELGRAKVDADALLWIARKSEESVR